MHIWILTTIIRLVVPISVLFFPIAGSILGVLSDITDIIVLDNLGANNIPEYYNQFDKLLDYYLYSLMAWQAWKQWKNKLAKKVALGLLLFRGVGVLIYEFFPERFLLFLFPNVFIWFYLFHLFSTQIFKKDYVRGHKSLAIILTALTIPKLYQEYLFHIVQIPIYQTWLNFIGMFGF